MKICIDSGQERHYWGALVTTALDFWVPETMQLVTWNCAKKESTKIPVAKNMDIKVCYFPPFFQEYLASFRETRQCTLNSTTTNTFSYFKNNPYFNENWFELKMKHNHYLSLSQLFTECEN